MDIPPPLPLDTQGIGGGCGRRRSKTVSVSAPGKLLLAGGYLVLDDSNAGLVVAVDRRFYAQCRVEFCPDDSKEFNEADKLASEEGNITVQVISPQFNTEWRYRWSSSKKSLVSATHDDANPFVEKALSVALLYLMPIQQQQRKAAISSITLTIAADNDFYSLVPHLQVRKMALSEGALLPLRLPAARDAETGQVYKTGLGSSACLVTALTGSLFYALPSLSSSQTTELNSSDNTAVATTQPTERDIRVIWKLAQIGHCYAQQKVGSGFDVSAACYGSHIYQRFPKALLEELLLVMESGVVDVDKAPTNTTKAAALRTMVDDTHWSGGVVDPVHCFSQSSLLQVTMADVSGGSESPSMARTVLAWRRSQQEQKQDEDAPVPHWDDLVRLNKQIVSLLQQVHNMSVDDETREALGQATSITWATLGPVGELLCELQTILGHARAHLRAMGNAADVPIEPPSQTHLCNDTQALPGVVSALVPGAGGHDAVACVHIHLPSVRAAVANMWTTWTGPDDTASVCSLTVHGADYLEGVRIEPDFPSIAADNAISRVK